MPPALYRRAITFICVIQVRLDESVSPRIFSGPTVRSEFGKAALQSDRITLGAPRALPVTLALYTNLAECLIAVVVSLSYLRSLGRP